MNLKTTSWYPASINPVRVGRYEVNSFGIKRSSPFFLIGKYRWWNGISWQLGGWSASKTIFGTHPSHLWRGIVEGAEAGNSGDKKATLILVCPSCNSPDCTVTAEQSFMVNTGTHYCHSVKTQDSDAKAACLYCNWIGVRRDLEEKISYENP